MQYHSTHLEPMKTLIKARFIEAVLLMIMKIIIESLGDKYFRTIPSSLLHNEVVTKRTRTKITRLNFKNSIVRNALNRLVIHRLYIWRAEINAQWLYSSNKYLEYNLNIGNLYNIRSFYSCFPFVKNVRQKAFEQQYCDYLI